MATIVCVEDEPAIRELIVGELTDAGHHVIEAGDGRQGLDAIMTQRPDLVLSDWKMPEMSGGELLETLRRDHPQFAGTPFVFVSAFVDKEYVERGSRFGAAAHLAKPIDFDILLETVGDLLASD